MRSERILQYIIACIMAVLTLTPHSAAQSNPARSITPHTGATDSVAGGRLSSLYAGSGYGNNLLYLGATMSQGNSFGYASAAYGLKEKLYLSATGYTISGLSPFIAFYSLDLSFSHTFNSWFDINTGLSRYNVAEKLRETLFGNFSYAYATIGLDWRLLYTQLSAGLYMADGTLPYVQARFSRYFETRSFPGNKAFFSIDPYVNILTGSIFHTEPSQGAIGTGMNQGTGTGADTGSGTWKRERKGRNQPPGTTITSSFGLIELDLGLPAAFSYDFFTLELEPGYIIPLYPGKELPRNGRFLFQASLFFRIF